MAENWADLPPELLELCSRRLLLEDWFAFRPVCSTWRAAAFEERLDIPWWMLEDDESTETEWAEFYSPFSLRIHRVLLPEVKGKKKCFSSRGWILTIGKDLQIHMLNPLSRAASRYRDEIVKLPSLDKFPGWSTEGFEPDAPEMYQDFLCKFVLSASPASTPNYTVMVNLWSAGPLCFWKPGNEEWIELTSPPDDHVFDVIHYWGQFVVVNSKGDIFTCDVDGPHPTAAQLILEMPPEIRDSTYLKIGEYLVESVGRLLLIVRFGKEGHGTAGFQVFVVDLDTRKWTKLESMGNVSLFVGFNSSFSVQLDENQQAIKPNCIYFTCFDDIGIYHMEDGRIEFDKEADYNVIPPLWIGSPPLWIEPRF
ncbi:hypothetical protein BT93_B2030 [Corymbia citriodora subsp. variegata]|nr:hypothetical protein BT93_B2030 [Corymbia citriodora subsp. variegata]